MQNSNVEHTQNKDDNTCILISKHEISVSSLVTSHLDYGNALLARVNDVVINNYQRVQNIAVKVILNIGKMDSGIEAKK